MAQHQYTIQPGAAWVYEAHARDLDAADSPAITRPSGTHEPPAMPSGWTGRTQAAMRTLGALWRASLPGLELPDRPGSAKAGNRGQRHLSVDEEQAAAHAYALYGEAMDEVLHQHGSRHRATLAEAVQNDGVVMRDFWRVGQSLDLLADYWQIKDGEWMRDLLGAKHDA